MRADLKQAAQAVTACVLAAIFAVPQSLMAQAAMHVVSPADLQKAALTATLARQQNLQTVKGFFASGQAKNALRSAHIDPEQVNNAVSSLSDAELAQLALRVQKVQANFAAGNLTDRDLIIILVAIAVLILIIVAVR
jgi:hypothetical protein